MFAFHDRAPHDNLNGNPKGAATSPHDPLDKMAAFGRAKSPFAASQRQSLDVVPILRFADGGCQTSVRGLCDYASGSAASNNVTVKS
jgi:hypothetical protein